MTHERFKDLFERRFMRSRMVLTNKAIEYSTGADRLHNFKQAANVMRGTQAEACFAFMTKHFVNVTDAVTNNENVSQEWIDEKIGDLVNYVILLEAILTEECVEARV